MSVICCTSTETPLSDGCWPGLPWRWPHWLTDSGTWVYFSLRRKKGPTRAGEKALRLWRQPCLPSHSTPYVRIPSKYNKRKDGYTCLCVVAEWGQDVGSFGGRAREQTGNQTSPIGKTFTRFFLDIPRLHLSGRMVFFLFGNSFFSFIWPTALTQVSWSRDSGVAPRVCFGVAGRTL